jgi:hypothetical protein
MKSLFEVNGINRFESNKKMIVSVYGVRTSETNKFKAEFLVYYNGHWIGMDADNYTPIANKHE